jgi:glutathione S-transferase
MLVADLLRPESSEMEKQIGVTLGGRYGYSPEAAAAAPARVAGILRLLSEQLARQREAGHDFLVGAALSALDIYWSTFAVLLAPLPKADCPIPGFLARSYANTGPVVGAALDPALIAHRDRIYRSYLELPMDF